MNKKTKKNIIGGDIDDTIDFPTGGFPPIYLCNNSQLNIQESENKNREYSSHKSSVSIKDLLNKRRDVTPLIVI